MESNRECGVRHKFSVKTRDLTPGHHMEESRRLGDWCRTFDAEGLAPVEGGASAGNLSFRTAAGFMITPTRSLLKAGLGWRDLVEVVREDWDAYELHVLGERIPSSDAFLHARIYAVRPDVAAVFHGHDDLVLAHADELSRIPGVVVTPTEMLFGTREDAIATAQALGQADYVIRKGHGFVAVGRTMDLAGARALEVHRRARALASGPVRPVSTTDPGSPARRGPGRSSR
jgi:ribulose-5-phosphate 4-epimerase/fuculose-1-phosphate aldolase